MKQNSNFTAYILIGIGIYFLAEQQQITIFQNFYSWPTFLMIIGIAFLLHSYSTKDYYHLFTGTLLLGLGIHFHGLENYAFWFDHWASYPLIIGIAFLVRYLKTKTNGLIGIGLIGASLFMIFSLNLPEYLQWMYYITSFLESFWPVVLIVLGVYILKRKK